MALIKCGRCSSHHPSVAEVRNCFNNQPAETVKVDRPRVPASEKQKAYIMRLLEDRVWSDASIGVETLSKDDASGIIGRLLTAPVKEEHKSDVVIGSVNLPEQGMFTVVWPNGDRRTYRFRRQPETSGFKPGKVLVGFLSGSDNDSDYTDFGHGMTDKSVRIWSRFAKDSDSTIIEGLRFLLGSKEAQAKAGEMYAIESGNCWRCGRTLTVPTSVARGLGPICAGIVGV